MLAFLDATEGFFAVPGVVDLRADNADLAEMLVDPLDTRLCRVVVAEVIEARLDQDAQRLLHLRVDLRHPRLDRLATLDVYRCLEEQLLALW